MFKYKLNIDNLVDRRGVTNVETHSQGGPLFKLDIQKSHRFCNSYMLKNQWNKLPASLRNIEDYNHFKMVRKRYRDASNTTVGSDGWFRRWINVF